MIDSVASPSVDDGFDVDIHYGLIVLMHWLCRCTHDWLYGDAMGVCGSWMTRSG